MNVLAEGRRTTHLPALLGWVLASSLKPMGRGLIHLAMLSTASGWQIPSQESQAKIVGKVERARDRRRLADNCNGSWDEGFNLTDVDSDGLYDYEEYHEYGTDWLNQDTDMDGLEDGGGNSFRLTAETDRMCSRPITKWKSNGKYLQLAFL